MLLVTRHSALLVLAVGATQNPQALRARTPWRTWSSSAARALRLAGGTGASHGFGTHTHATSHERLFLFGKKIPTTPATTDTVTTVTHLDFNPHRVSRTRTTSSAVHGCCCARLPGVGSNSLRGHRKRGECGHEEQESEVVDFTVEELPYRQTRSTLLDDSDAYFGTDRIVFVRSMVRVCSICLLFPTVLTKHLGFSAVQKVDQGSGVGYDYEGLMRRRVIVHPMMG